VSFVVKEDKTLDPMDAGFLGFWALVPRADGVANLIEQLRLLRCWKTDHSISFGTTAETAGEWEDSLSVGLAMAVYSTMPRKVVAIHTPKRRVRSSGALSGVLSGRHLTQADLALERLSVCGDIAARRPVSLFGQRLWPTRSRRNFITPMQDSTQLQEERRKQYARGHVSPHGLRVKDNGHAAQGNVSYQIRKSCAIMQTQLVRFSDV
jgi:hypothetical protein